MPHLLREIGPKHSREAIVQSQASKRGIVFDCSSNQLHSIFPDIVVAEIEHGDGCIRLQEPCYALSALVCNTIVKKIDRGDCFVVLQGFSDGFHTSISDIIDAKVD